MERFPKRSKNELKLKSKNRSKPIGKPTFRGSSWRLMLASSWLQNCHVGTFLFMNDFRKHRPRFVAKLWHFHRLFQFFWHRQQQLFKSWKCFLQTGPGCSKPALGNNAKHWKSRRFWPNLAPCYRLRPFSDELMLSCTFWGGNTENADVFGRLIITESSQSGTLPARIVGFQYRFLKGPLLARPSGIFRFLNTFA